MALKQFIAHRLDRHTEGATAVVTESKSTLAVDGRADELLRELKQVYVGKAGKSYGQFSVELGDYPLSSWIKEYLAERLGFASLSQKLMQHAKLELEQSSVCGGGYWLLMHEQLADCDLLYLFVLEHSEGLYLDGDLLMGTSFYLDASQIMLGAKINLTEWQAEDNRHYLSVLRARGDKDLTEVFHKLIGFTDKVDVTADTTEFLDAVSSYTRALPEEQAQETRTKVVDYCLQQDKQGEPVVMADLSSHMNESEPQDFSRYLVERQPQAKAELIPDRNQLRQFVRISGRNDSLSMSFSSDCLGESVVYDLESDSLTISNLPSALKSRLLRYLQQQGPRQQSDSVDEEPQA